MSDHDNAPDWETFRFDREVTFPDIPSGLRTAALHVSVAPVPSDGGVRILGRMANGGTGSITLRGTVFAAKLPFADRVIRLQFLGDTRAVDVALTSYVRG